MEVGSLLRWNGDHEWIAISSRVAMGESQIEVRYGDLFWLTDTGVVIDTVNSSYVDPKLLARSIDLGIVTREQYREAVRDKRLSECPADAPIIKTEARAPEHLAKLVNVGVTFFTPGK